MHCFHHHDAEAIGICKVCNKGLCEQCAADLGHSIACQGRHETEAAALRAMQERGMRLQRAAGMVWYLAPVAYAIMSAIFIVFGWRELGSVGGFLVVMGVCMLLYAVVVFMIRRRAYKAADRGPQGDRI